MHPALPTNLFRSWEEVVPISKNAKTSFLAVGFNFPITLAKAHARRLDEFLAGRYCVHKTFGEFGEATYLPIETLESRAPQWPAGYIGSISHTKGKVWTVLAKSDQVKFIGNDMELIMSDKTAQSIKTKIIIESEQYDYNKYNEKIDFRTYITLIFSAKESLYKALYPMVQEFFGFEDAVVKNINFEDNLLDIKLLKDFKNNIFKGSLYKVYFSLGDGFLKTMILEEY